MDINIARFNRIIDLKLETSDGKSIVIKCPRHGRKPSIEISGSYNSRGFLPAFNVTVKNLYLNLQTEQYSKITVEAGYAGTVKGSTVTIEGTILTIYQEEPGPEGRTVIQCQQGEMQSWLDATVQLDYEENTSITEILEAIKNKLGATDVKTGTKARTLTTKQPFKHDGTARSAMLKLESCFKDNDLVVFLRENTLYAEIMGEGDFIGIKVLKYISAPPQPNTGGSKGTYYTTVTAPWIPDLNLFDKLQIPSSVYIKNYGLVGNATNKTQNIQVTTLSFHFGTTGNVNSMTVQGPLA